MATLSPRALACGLLSVLFTFPLCAQQVASATLPEAPGLGAFAPQPDSTGSIGGTVLDIRDGLVSGATVTLIEEKTGSVARTLTSDSEGRFVFSGLPAGSYHVTITARGLERFASQSIHVAAGQQYEMQRIALPIAPATYDVQVTVTQKEIATEQLDLQIHQRFLGVFPNFYSSYIWDAAPLTPGQKFHLAARSIIDPVAFLTTAAQAGAEQYNNSYSGYGQGAEGYGKRYGADFADHVTHRMFAGAIYPVLFHQDPRYFYRGSGTKTERAWYAISRTFVTRSDAGKPQPNYSLILAAFTAGAISNAYRPDTDRGAGLTFRNAGVEIGSSMIDSLIREFVLRHFTPKVPGYATGKPESKTKATP